MPQITKIDAFQCVVDAMEDGDYRSANEMLAIITRSNENDRRNKTFTRKIELKTKKEIRLFQKYKKMIL